MYLINLFTTDSYLFYGFASVLVISLLLDINFLRKQSAGMSTKAAFMQSAAWVGLAVAYGVLLYYTDGRKVAAEYFSAYLMEYSLSMDNIFVFVLILSFFKISNKYYAKVLFYGILMAIVFRLLFISVGIAVVNQFHWVLYIFGAFLIYTGYKILFTNEEDQFDPAESAVYKLMKKYFPLVDDEANGNFTIIKDGKKYYSLLFTVIVIIGTTDIIFALDSIPAAFAITQNMLVIVTSNIFAVIGLRAMFFMLMKAVDQFRFLQQGISFVLIFIGLKMLAQIVDYHIGTEFSLAIIASILGGSVVMSLIIPSKKSENS